MPAQFIARTKVKKSNKTRFGLLDCQHQKVLPELPFQDPPLIRTTTANAETQVDEFNPLSTDQTPALLTITQTTLSHPIDDSRKLVSFLPQIAKKEFTQQPSDPKDFTKDPKRKSNRLPVPLRKIQIGSVNFIDQSQASDFDLTPETLQLKQNFQTFQDIIPASRNQSSLPSPQFKAETPRKMLESVQFTASSKLSPNSLGVARRVPSNDPGLQSVISSQLMHVKPFKSKATKPTRDH